MQEIRTYLFRLIFAAIILMPYAGCRANNRPIPADFQSQLDNLAMGLIVENGTPKEQILALQTWINENIAYDETTNEVQKEWDTDQMAYLTCSSRKGNSFQVANLLSVLAKKMGIGVFVIKGYLVKEDANATCHDWCGCMINGQPYLTDPTCRCQPFSKNDKHYLAHPDSLKFTYIPFDPLMQLRPTMLTYEQQEKKIDADTPNNVNNGWLDSLNAYLKQDAHTQKKAAYKRMEPDGEHNKLVTAELTRLKNAIEDETISFQIKRSESIMYKLSDLHNWIVDLNFMSSNIERTMRNKIDGISGELDDMTAQLNAITNRKKTLRYKVAKDQIDEERQMLNKCENLLKKKKKR